MAASARTDRKTWRRLAPTMRSRASSRVRCPTMMENVLRMVKPPTKSAMNAKTSRAMLKKLSAWPIAPVASSTTVWPVTTSTPGGRARGDGALHALRLRPGVATTLMVSNLPTSPSTRLGRGDVERGEGGSGQVVGGAEAGQAADGERPWRALQEDPHPLTHREVVLLGRSQVHDDVVGRRGCPSPGQSERGEALIGVEGDPEGGGAPGRDRLALVRDVLRVPGHRALGDLHPRHGAHGREDRLGDRVPGGRAAAAELRNAADLEIDVLVDVPEERVEGVVQRVRQDEGPGNEGDPEHDGQRGEGQPELVGQQSLERDLPHVRSPVSACARAPCRASAVPARPRRCRRRGR